MEERICMCCGSKLVEYNELSHNCSKCYTVFVDTIPTDDEISNYYDSYLANYHGGGRSKGSAKRQDKYANKYFKILSKYKSGETLIDVGSANNPFPNIANKNGYKVSVADLNKPQNLNSDIRFIESSIENLDLNGEEYDNVTAFAILEHTKNPIKAIESLVKLCKHNGSIIIYIPEMGRFPDKYALGTSKWFCPPEHLNLLSKKGLSIVMADLNCKLFSYYRFELNIFRYVIRYGIGIIEGIFGFMVKLISKKLWNKYRKERKNQYKGMEMYIFKKYKTA